MIIIQVHYTGIFDAGLSTVDTMQMHSVQLLTFPLAEVDIK